MLYNEASYFEGYHFQHIADWYDHTRQANRRRQELKLLAAAPNRSKRPQESLCGLGLFEPPLLLI